MELDIAKGIIWKFVSYKVAVEGTEFDAGVKVDLEGLKAELKTLIPGGIDDVIIDMVFKIVFGG